MPLRHEQAPAKLPRQLLPMVATSSEPFDDPAYLFEIKWDGVRALASIASGRLRLWGRQGTDYDGRYPELDVLRKLPYGTMVDGELVLIRDGHADFQALMSRHLRRPARAPFFAEPIRYVVFDLLYLGGRCLMDLPLVERRDLLNRTLPDSEYLACCEGTIGNGRATFRSALAAGHEGVVAKRLTSRYTPGKRNDAWKKIKYRLDLPCVVIGYRLNSTGLRDLLMATLMDGKPSYVGPIELGVRRRAEALKRLEGLRIAKPAVPCSVSAYWVKPELFCTVRFCGWRPGGSWRDAVFAGWDNLVSPIYEQE
jgi:bifunctional non-homologous end joining protein LigD